MIAYRVTYINDLGKTGEVYFASYEHADAWVIQFTRGPYAPPKIDAVVIHMEAIV
jgi:hypothetical protein